MISLIWAMDEHHLIGRVDDLPWHFKEDLKFFKDTTLYHKVLMGRKTFDSIYQRNHHPLPNRENYVCTTKNLNIENIILVKNLEEFLQENEKTEDEVFVIGGASIYKKALPYANKLYITYIQESYVGDIYFPEFQLNEYDLQKEIKSENSPLIWRIYERRNKIKC